MASVRVEVLENGQWRFCNFPQQPFYDPENKKGDENKKRRERNLTLPEKKDDTQIKEQQLKAIRKLQFAVKQAVVGVHLKGYDKKKKDEVLIEISSAVSDHAAGKNIVGEGNYSIHWNEHYKKIAEALCEVAIPQFRVVEYDRAFADMGWFLRDAQIQCIVAFLHFKDFQVLQNFVKGTLDGNHIKKLQEIFFTNELIENVKLLPYDLSSTLNNAEEKEDVEKMLESLLSNLKIAVYFDYFELVNLLIKQKSKATPSKLKIVIDLPWKGGETQIEDSETLQKMYSHMMPKGFTEYTEPEKMAEYTLSSLISIYAKHPDSANVESWTSQVWGSETFDQSSLGELTKTPQMIKVAALPNGENIEVAEILVENYRQIFEGVDPDLPLLSIAITGEMRTGKSFLLNLLLMYLEYIEHKEASSDEGWEESNQPIVGIDWAAGGKAVTQGIWMLDQPIIFTRKNKEKIAIVIIDIQGLGDSDNSDEAIDNLLMYVGLQMCNVQIINVNRKFNSFHFVKVASCATYSEINDKVPSAFGTLVLMARDFTLAEESKLGLQCEQFSVMKADAKHATMKETFERISRCFKKVVCFNFPRPSDNVSHHQARTGMLNLCGEEIGYSFLKYCKDLFHYLLRIQVEANFTVDYSIKMFEGLKKRIAALTDGLPNTEHVIMDVSINKILITSQKHYEELMAEKLDFSKFGSEESLEKVLESRIKSTIELFEKECEFGSDLGPKFLSAKTHYLEQLVAFLDVEKNKQVSDYRGYIAEKEKRELEAKVENERHKAQEVKVKLKEAEKEKEKLKEKEKELEEKVEEEKQRALAAAAEKQEAEAKLQKTEAMKEELEEEKKQIQASAEQEKAKAAEAAAREKETRDKLHTTELEAIAAKTELEERKNKANTLEQEISQLKEKENARNQETERELITLREQIKEKDAEIAEKIQEAMLLNEGMKTKDQDVVAKFHEIVSLKEMMSKMLAEKMRLKGR